MEAVVDRNPRDVLTDPRAWLLGIITGIGIFSAFRAARRPPSQPREAQPQGRRPRVVVLGGGFAGLTAARVLQQRLAGGCEVLLIDRHNYQLFTPLLFQVAACGVDPYSITYPLRHFTDDEGITFQAGIVSGVDFDARRVELRDSADVSYDYLVIALGSTTDFFDNKSAQEHAMPLKTVEDGLAIRNQILDALERGAKSSDEEERRSLLTFVVVGGGATGVETAAALSELLRHTLPDFYPNIALAEHRIVVIEAADKLLGHMKDPAASVALDRLRKLGVEVWLSTEAKEVGAGRVTASDGRTVEARTIIWATGVKAPEVVSSMSTDHGKGGSLAVDSYLQVKGRPGVYAVGDCAHVEDPDRHSSVPLLAESAVQEGRAAAENIARAFEGRPQLPFHFHSLGTLVSLGRSRGIAQFGRFVLNGLPGAVAWHLVHLAKIPSYRDRLSTSLDWSAGYVHDRDTARLEVQPEEVRAHHDGTGREL